MLREMNLCIGGGKSKDEREGEGNNDQVVEDEVLNQEEEIFLKVIYKIGKRPKLDVPTFLGNLNPMELIDWVYELEYYFEYEDIEDLDRVKFAKAKLKGHGKIW